MTSGDDQPLSISSAVVRVDPDQLKEMASQLDESDLCEVHMTDEAGSIIVTLEGGGGRSDREKFEALQMLPGVLSAEMVFSYNDEEE